MADVYEARDTRLKRIVAVKVLRSDLWGDSQFIDRFQKEAHASAQLNNPFIVSTYDAGEDIIVNTDGSEQNVSFIVMEYVRGETLKAILKERGALSYQEASKIIEGVLIALDYSHKAGLVHRDIKPGNVMITESGQVKVMDFGIARALADSSATQTESKSVLGTAQYLSPEQAKGELVDSRSDLYSAGCVFYEMLTGKTPFTGDSPVAIAYQHVSENAVPASELNPNVPPLFDKIIAKALQKDRKNRYQKAQSFRNDVRLAVEHSKAAFPLTPTNQETEVLSPLTMPSDINAGETSQIQTEAISRQQALENDEKAKKKRLIIIFSIIGAVVVAAAIVLVLVFMNPFGGKTEPTSTVTIAPVASPSATPKPGTVVIEDLHGLSQEAARNAIESAGLEVGEIVTENSPDVEKDKVTRTDPPAGQSVEAKSKVKLYISTGMVDLPDFTGMSKDAVREKLTELKLIVSFDEEESSTVKPGTAISQLPAAGTIPQHASVSVKIAKKESAIIVPESIIGVPQENAMAMLQDLELTPSLVMQASDTVQPGYVVSSNPTPGSGVKRGTAVTLYISSGPAPTPGP
jgi:serine/threonine-protein kinase